MNTLVDARNLVCCCCGNSTIGRQWWNRDKGFGICKVCVPLLKSKYSPSDFEECCGKEGIHFNIFEEKYACQS